MTKVDKLIQEIDDLMEAGAEMSRFSDDPDIDPDLVTLESRLKELGYQLEFHDQNSPGVTIADAPYF